MSIKTVRRMAASILKAGESRVWLDPLRLEDLKKAITKDDVRHLIRKGYVDVHKKKGVPRTRGRIRARKKKEGRARGKARKHGTYSARLDTKTRWIARIRAQRKLLNELRSKDKLESGFREVYLRIKGGSFPDKSHLRSFLLDRGYLKK